MTREEAEALIIRYLDQEVTDEERRQVEQLRSIDEEFAGWYEQTESEYRALSELAGQAGHEAIPMDVFYRASDRITTKARERLERRREQPTGRSLGGFLNGLIQPVPNLAGALAAVALVWLVTVPLQWWEETGPAGENQVSPQRDLIRGMPDSTDLGELQGLMNQHIQSGDYEEAIAAFEEFAKTPSGAAVKCTRHAANLWVTVAGLYQQKGDLKRAGEYLIRAGKCLQGE